MRKSFIIALLFCIGVLMVQGQSQRMVLYEGFTNASCSPCASANPSINLLIKNNYSKLVPIKYQVNWPGFDPMNAQNPQEVGTRVSYYGITGVPGKRINGSDLTFSQAVIDAQYAIPAPFDLSISHQFNETFDSVHVECIIAASQDFSSTQLKLHIAMLEKEISFTTAPGANGEKTFAHVMRKMYPNDQGTTLPNTWVSGQSDTIRFTAKIPNYIYNLSQVHFIAFVQSNANKAVHQAAKDNLQEMNNYLKITKHNIPVEPGCYEQLGIQLTINNYGINQIDSFDVEFGVVGGSPNIFKWNGALTTNQSTIVNLPSFEIPVGSSVVYAEIKNPNGQSVYPKVHTRVQSTLSLITNYTMIPLEEGFSNSTFPPTAWNVLSYDESVAWERASVGGFGQTPGGSAFMSFFNSPSGQIDLMYAKPIDLSTFSAVEMSFSVAYARYDASFSDALRVQVSTNCGQTWTNVYNKSGTLLATAPDKTTAFTPTASQWRKEVVSLNNYAGNTKVLIRFYGLSGYGNNLYIDDLFIGTPSSIDKNDESITNFSIFPNPVVDEFVLDFKLNQLSDVNLDIYDNLGRNIYSASPENLVFGNNSLSINSNSWNSGLYHVVLRTETGIFTSKIVKQ